MTQGLESELKIVVLFGVGGVGKTQLATEFSYRYQHEFSTIFWIDGTSLESIRLSLLDALDNIGHHYKELALDSDFVYL